MERDYYSTDSEEEGFVIAALEVSPVPKVGTDPLVQDRPVFCGDWVSNGPCPAPI